MNPLQTLLLTCLTLMFIGALVGLALAGAKGAAVGAFIGFGATVAVTLLLWRGD